MAACRYNKATLRWNTHLVYAVDHDKMRIFSFSVVVACSEKLNNYVVHLLYIFICFTIWKITSDIFHILTSEDINDVIYCFLHWNYIINRKLHSGLKIWILSSPGEQNIFTHSLRSFVKYCFHHLKIKSISSRHRVISPM